MVGSSASGASRLVLDVVELQRRTGTRRDVGASLVLPDLEVGERCVLDGRLDVDLVVEAIGGADGEWTRAEVAPPK